MIQKDCLRRFLFQDSGVRGEWINLRSSWQALKEKHQYPAIVQEQLGQGMAAVAMLSATVKFKGSMIMQVQGDGKLRALVAQCTHDRKIRGMARFDQEIKFCEPDEVYGEGRLVLTIESERADPYQGIVPLTGQNLAAVLQNYFSQSEQLKTRLWLYADEFQASGLLIQELPSQEEHKADWERIEMLAATVTQKEMMTLSCEELLYRLFNEEHVMLYEPEAVIFRCSCSLAKIENTLFSLGRASLDDILKERDDIEVDCEFCNHQYRFDKVDIERIMNRGVRVRQSGFHH